MRLCHFVMDTAPSSDILVSEQPAIRYFWGPFIEPKSVRFVTTLAGKLQKHFFRLQGNEGFHRKFLHGGC